MGPWGLCCNEVKVSVQISLGNWHSNLLTTEVSKYCYIMITREWSSNSQDIKVTIFWRVLVVVGVGVGGGGNGLRTLVNYESYL